LKESNIIEILNKELVRSLGCTEPITITYAVALARKQIKNELITKVEIKASRNLIKNAMSVTIPGTRSCKINLSSALLAGALGVIKPLKEKNFEILSDLNKNDVENAKELVSEGLIDINLYDSKSKLYLEVIVESRASLARVVIEDSHSNVKLIEVNGEIIKKNDHVHSNTTKKCEYDNFLNIKSILEFVQKVEVSKLEIIKKTIEINKNICQEGLEKSYGLKVGRSIEINKSTGFFSNDIVSNVVAYTAAGSDARMSGCSLPAMSNSGSGNQGISATIPVVIVAEEMNFPMEKEIRAVTLSNLITLFIKSNIGRLSAVCGASISAMGACCGITFLLGGERREIESALQLMMANVTGIICDGAKSGCALKISTCTFAAVQTALMALDGISIDAKEGIIEDEAEKTMKNFCNVANSGMVKVDQLILDIMLQKSHS